MKQLFLMMLMIGTGWQCLQAQQKTPYGQSDPQAKAVLDAVSQKFKSYKTVKASFVLKVEGQDGKLSDSKTGTVILQGTSYHINMDDQELICDGKTTWNYSKENNEVQINNYEPDNGTITPSRLFSNFYDKDFLYHLLPESTVKGRKMENVEMTPLDKSKSFFKVILTIDKQNKQMTTTKVFDKSGNHYTYEVRLLTPNVPVPDNTFAFDTKAHPNVDVVDLR